MATNQKLGTAELLYQCATQLGLRPQWVLQGSLFSIVIGAERRYIHEAKSTLNSHLSSSLTSNKLNTRLILEQRGLPGIAFLNPKNLAEAEEFLAQHAKIIVKPLAGSNSRDVHIVDAPEQLRAMDLPKYILEKYIAGKELRYLVLNNRVIAVHESQYGQSVAETRALQRLSYPKSTWDPGLVALALKTAQVLHSRFAAVDYLIGPQGQIHILEVNSSPGMKWFHAPTSGPVVNVARMFLEAMLDDMQPSAPLPSVPLATPPIKAYS